MQNLDGVLIEEPEPAGGHTSYSYEGLVGGAPEDGIEASLLDAAALQAPSASEFSNARLIEELEMRKMRPTGFRDQDVITLQRVLDEEFEREKEHMLQQQREQRERAVKQAGLQRKRALLERQLQQEKEAIASDHRVESWLDRIMHNSTPPAARIHITSVTARSLAKAMWNNQSLQDLDVTRNDLDDFAGAYMAKLLKRNTALEKLEMGHNNLGALASASFAESLSANTTLRHLGLESNPLCPPGSEEETAKSLAALIRQNSSLTSLSLWKCGLDERAGAAIADALESNSTLTNLDVGLNAFKEKDLQKIRVRLDENVQSYEHTLSKRRKEAEVQRAIQQEEQRIAEELRKERELQEWLEDQRRLRAELRRKQQEDAYAAKVAQLAEEAAALELEKEAQRKAAEAAAAKKNKKKGGKKK